ncbi:HipA family kinase [Arthrobacter sp. Soc17.1.1.1]|uniref:HipA family kinase n=1 Tax=Arthrobacter sp. Soc17.1.1.1 TaxID=3121277 RepID=UPI002FE49550
MSAQLLGSHTRGRATTTLVAPIQTSDAGSRPFLALAEDDNTYWVKPLGNPHGLTSLIAEQVVAHIGFLIGAPVRPVTLVDIPQTMDGWPYGEGLRVRPGVAHASLHLESHPLERDVLEYVKRDHNAERQPRFIALWEWCAGEDEQWLYDLGADHEVWSFDHGYWLGGGGLWTPSDLQRQVGLANSWTGPVRGMSAPAFVEVASRIRDLRVDDIAAAVASVPIEWGVSEEDLGHIVEWLDARRPALFDRLMRHAFNV